jgi:hypothetical protein
MVQQGRPYAHGAFLPNPIHYLLIPNKIALESAAHIRPGPKHCIILPTIDTRITIDRVFTITHKVRDNLTQNR